MHRSTSWPLNIISQITIKRRSALYIVNFMLPVLFFLCLDLASFMISDSGGEKLSFKITVLLAVTVLQLILNEILPSSSNRIPLIGKEAQTHSFIGLHFVWAGTAHTNSMSSCLSALICFLHPFSGLLYWDFWFNDAEPPGDDFGDVSD